MAKPNINLMPDYLTFPWPVSSLTPSSMLLVTSSPATHSHHLYRTFACDPAPREQLGMSYSCYSNRHRFSFSVTALRGQWQCCTSTHIPITPIPRGTTSVSEVTHCLQPQPPSSSVSLLLTPLLTALIAQRPMRPSFETMLRVAFQGSITSLRCSSCKPS